MGASESETHRAACHEAGHIIAALHYGIRFGDLKSVNQVPTLEVYLPPQGEAASHFLVAGIASEELTYSNYHELAARSDLELLKSVVS